MDRPSAQVFPQFVEEELERAVAADHAGQHVSGHRPRRGEQHRLDPAFPFAPTEFGRQGLALVVLALGEEEASGGAEAATVQKTGDADSHEVTNATVAPVAIEASTRHDWTFMSSALSARFRLPLAQATKSLSGNPTSLPGNIENFIGAAQVPVGLAGPLRVNGEHARGDF